MQRNCAIRADEFLGREDGQSRPVGESRLGHSPLLVFQQGSSTNQTLARQWREYCLCAAWFTRVWKRRRGSAGD